MLAQYGRVFVCLRLNEGNWTSLPAWVGGWLRGRSRLTVSL